MYTHIYIYIWLTIKCFVCYRYLYLWYACSLNCSLEVGCGAFNNTMFFRAFTFSALWYSKHIFRNINTPTKLNICLWAHIYITYIYMYVYTYVGMWVYPYKMTFYTQETIAKFLGLKCFWMKKENMWKETKKKKIKMLKIYLDRKKRTLSYTITTSNASTWYKWEVVEVILPQARVINCQIHF